MEPNNLGGGLYLSDPGAPKAFVKKVKLELVLSSTLGCAPVVKLLPLFVSSLAWVTFET